MKDRIILTLYKRPETVFTLQEIVLLFPHIPYINLKKRMSYFATSGSIKKLTRNIYAKDEFSFRELANKLYTPSYISLETVLQQSGVTFQYYERIFSISYMTREITVSSQVLQYRRIKQEILINNEGIVKDGTVMIASPERAFLDAVYLYKNYHFDNLGSLNWDKIMELKKIYQSRILNKRVE